MDGIAAKTGGAEIGVGGVDRIGDDNISYGFPDNDCDCVRERPCPGNPRLYSTISSSNRFLLIDLEELK